mgnify:CR=1 FL=1
MRYDGGDDRLYINADEDTRTIMALNRSNAYVGVGTTAPQAPFQVVGDFGSGRDTGLNIRSTNSSGYGPSKAALTNFAESIYFDFKKHNVKVSVVSPGFIKTPLTDKNEFPMPFLRSPEFAANKVYDGLVKTNSFEIDFPKQLTFTLKFLRILPYKIYLFLVDKLVKR